MQIGRYTVDGELGRGGMGVVLRVRDPAGRVVALKLLEKDRSDRAERFAREARLQEQLGEAAGFVPLLDIGTSAHGPFLVMPLLPGGTLRDRLLAGPLGVDEAVELTTTLADALGRAHEAGVVHRDMKPDNVLFTEDGRPLVADLGLGKHFRRDLSGASLSVALSAGGEMRGTLGYVAPEQLRDASAVGPPADVFALGVVLYECLTGRQPFVGATFMELLAAVASGAKDPLPGDCPRWLRDVVDQALAPSPQDRIPDAAAFASALRARRSRSRLPRLGIALFVLAGLSAGAVAV
ncbi:MAG: serine/threonine protein kinase, partial [Planctomycetes bacterium]|nr:serine/threonine protein kinase [Planctomycetota bacterium]